MATLEFLYGPESGHEHPYWVNPSKTITNDNLTLQELINTVKPNLQYVRFTRQDLRGLDFSDCDLTGADLVGANLSESDLSGAALASADMRECVLTNAKLCAANLTNADLLNACLAEADLSFSTLNDTNLGMAYLVKANLHRATLTGASLVGANLTSANLTGADFSGANLTGASLVSANAQGANFTGAKLRELTLASTSFDDTTIFDPQSLEPNVDLVGYKAMMMQKVGGYMASQTVICQLQIPADSQRTDTLTSNKCRCEYAKVTAVFSTWEDESGKYIEIDPKTIKLLESKYWSNNQWVFGQNMVADSYDDRRDVVSTNGIHFFKTFEEARKYATM